MMMARSVSQSNIQMTYDGLFGLFVVFVVCDFMIANLVMLALAPLFLFRLKEYKSEILEKIKQPAFVVFFTFVFYAYLRLVIIGSFDEKIFRLLILPLLVMLLSFQIKEWNYSYLGFIGAAFVMSLWGLFNIVHRYMYDGIYDMTSGSIINELLIVQRPFLGFILVTACLLSIHFSNLLIKYRFIFYFLAVFFASYIVIISARMAFLSIVFIGVLYLLFYSKVGVFKKLISTAVFVSGFGLLVFLTPSLSNRFVLNERFETIQNQLKDYEPRVTIWECGFGIISKADFNVLFGIGSQEEIVEAMVACYAGIQDNLSRRDYFIAERFHLHNQFLDTYAMFGLIGLVLFISYFALIFLKNKSSFIPTAILVSILSFCMVDLVFYFQIGIYLFAILSVFCLNFKQASS